jgi:hypothetical protein
MMTAYQADAPIVGDGETVHVHQTDGNGGWLFTLTQEGVQITEGHPAAVTEAKGTASDILLVLWRRLPLDRLEITGDRTLVERLVGAPTLD